MSPEDVDWECLFLCASVLLASDVKIPDLSGKNNYALRGRLPTLQQVMTYGNGDAKLPTPPRYVASAAPLVGTAPITVYTTASQRVTIDLFAFDPVTATLTVRV